MILTTSHASDYSVCGYHKNALILYIMFCGMIGKRKKKITSKSQSQENCEDQVFSSDFQLLKSEHIDSSTTSESKKN